jgi:hypothetical protein
MKKSAGAWFQTAWNVDVLAVGRGVHEDHMNGTRGYRIV